MQRTTCEHVMWNGLPVIRKEIVVSMINDYGLNQKETAEKLGITPAAVCQYLSKKRGKPHIYNEKILTEIKLSAKKIIDNGNGQIISETCRICKLVRKSTEYDLFYRI
jgi:predicted transcriptional regulator